MNVKITLAKLFTTVLLGWCHQSGLHFTVHRITSEDTEFRLCIIMMKLIVAQYQLHKVMELTSSKIGYGRKCSKLLTTSTLCSLQIEVGFSVKHITITYSYVTETSFTTAMKVIII